jgi:SAM-dependent methyltransferase
LTDVYSSAFTTHAKYFHELTYAADDTKCDRADFIRIHYNDEMFDIVTLCEPLNKYNNPVSLLQNLCSLLKKGGLLLFKLRNTDDIQTLLRSTGLGKGYDGDFASALPQSEILECLKFFGMKNSEIFMTEKHGLTEIDKGNIAALLKVINDGATQNDLEKLVTQNFLFKAIKG